MSTQKFAAIVDIECARARAFLDKAENARTALLPILQAVQSEFGYIDKDVLPMIAEELNISQAEVRGVVSFYHDFRLERPGRHVLRLCRAEACQSMGCESLVEHLKERHALAPGDTLPDASLTFENVYCLGNCALAPAGTIDGKLAGRVNKAWIDQIILGTRR